MNSIDSKWQHFFLGSKAPWYLAAAALFIFTGWLTGHPIWTQEYRWQHVCLNMSRSGDYFHPILDGHPYYDKPLLSYWLMLSFGKLTGGLGLMALRLPSILAAGAVLYSVFSIGRFWFDRKTGLIAAWLCLSTFYIIFWARVASTDMLNVAFIMLPCAWLFACEQALTHVKTQAVLLLLLVTGALLKGLIAPVLSFLVIGPWLIQQNRYRAFLQWRSLWLALLAAIVYLGPFVASNLSHHGAYSENGLSQVFQENIVRFFKPFDHQGGIQTYFIYAPVYLLPWTPLWLLALRRFLPKWRSQNPGIQWLNWANVSIFVFLSLSGSRRSYYILPLVPFALLQSAVYWQQCTRAWQQRLVILLGLSYGLMLSYFVFIQPCYYSRYF